jgi:hypothetical protein
LFLIVKAISKNNKIYNLGIDMSGGVALDVVTSGVVTSGYSLLPDELPRESACGKVCRYIQNAGIVLFCMAGGAVVSGAGALAGAARAARESGDGFYGNNSTDTLPSLSDPQFVGVAAYGAFVGGAVAACCLGRSCLGRIRQCIARCCQ